MSSLVAPEHCSAQEDAEVLYKACKGIGTDEKAIISILGHRNAFQRKQIREAYAERYHDDLIKRLESELSGHLEKAVYRWILDPQDRDAVLANVAIKKSGDYDVIIEIACTLSSEELLAVKRAYEVRYHQSLEEDLAAHTTGDTRKLLLGLIATYRYQGNELNVKLAKSEAEILRNTIKNKLYNNEELLRVITTRSKMQLIATLNCYRDHYGSSFAKDLRDDDANGYKKLLRNSVRIINDHKKYYEKVLRNAIKRFGTDEDAVTRVLITRADKDLKEIQEMYRKRNNDTLANSIAKETSGYYKNFLLALLGEKD